MGAFQYGPYLTEFFPSQPSTLKMAQNCVPMYAGMGSIGTALGYIGTLNRDGLEHYTALRHYFENILQ